MMVEQSHEDQPASTPTVVGTLSPHPSDAPCGPEGLKEKSTEPVAELDAALERGFDLTQRPASSVWDGVKFLGVLAYLLCALIWESLSTGVNFVAFLCRRHVHRRASREVILLKGAAKRLVLLAFLCFCLAGLGPLGCRQWTREWGHFAWSVSTVTDISGDWDGLVYDLTVLGDPEEDQFVETFELWGF